MKDERRLLPRAAAKIHRSLTREEEINFLPRLPETVWQECCDSAQKILTAKSRVWFYSLEKLERIWMQKITRFQNAVTARVELFLETIRPRETISFREIYNDLVALDDEFDDVDYDLISKTIAVTTEPIVLEDLYLGPFQIRLNWGDLDSSPAYTVIALEPNCASVNGETVHPHVENDVLCEGDGSEKIAAALKNGCLFEFFLLVRQVHETYNDANAYVSLSNWDGTSCPACGDPVDDESVADFYEDQVDRGREPFEFSRIWIHTHPGESAEPSLTDEETFARCFGNCDWALMFILAQEGEFSARLQFQVGPGAVLRIPVEIDYKSKFRGSDRQSWNRQYLENVQPELEWYEFENEEFARLNCEEQELLETQYEQFDCIREETIAYEF